MFWQYQRVVVRRVKLVGSFTIHHCGDSSKVIDWDPPKSHASKAYFFESPVEIRWINSSHLWISQSCQSIPSSNLSRNMASIDGFQKIFPTFSRGFELQLPTFRPFSWFERWTTRFVSPWVPRSHGPCLSMPLEISKPQRVYHRVFVLWTCGHGWPFSCILDRSWWNEKLW